MKFIKFILHFKVALFQICFVWLATPTACDVIALVIFKIRREEDQPQERIRGMCCLRARINWITWCRIISHGTYRVIITCPRTQTTHPPSIGFCSWKFHLYTFSNLGRGVTFKTLFKIYIRKYTENSYHTI